MALSEVLNWIIVAIGWLYVLTVLLILTIGLAAWITEGYIKPWRIPQSEIDAEADMLITEYSDPEYEAYARLEDAWFRSDGFEQARSRRILRAVRHKLQ